MKNIEINETEDKLPSQFANILGLKYTSTVTKEHKKKEGQFFTPFEISQFMGNMASKPKSNVIKILDAGCGTAILTCSLIEKLIEFEVEMIELTAYETDYNLISYTEQSLQNLKNWLLKRDIKFSYTLIANDFIKEMANSLEYKESFDYIISNPPYFKLSKEDTRIRLLQHLVKGQPNIYSFFMAVSVSLLKNDGELIFIVPRSFASGQYFNSFRNYFFSIINLNFVHLFSSRSKTFDRDKVLQETLILKGNKSGSDKIIISTSEGLQDLYESKEKEYHISDIINLDSDAKILHLPINEFEEKVMQLFKSWTNTLLDFDIQISTGPVVSFRSKEFLFETYQNATVFLTPLYWLHNVKKMKIEWPIFLANKEQYINDIEESKRILIPNRNYVLLRRFSSKDDKSRLIAAPYFSELNPNKFIGVENKLNYIYKKNSELQPNEIIGIAAFLNSNLFDTYFRTFNGNVNVSATEIRLMPFPSIQIIREIGDNLIIKNDYSQNQIDRIINLSLKQNPLLKNE